MNFSELESLMSSRGIASLAEIARTLNTTPQAVSNWKARNQIPHHIVAKLNQYSPLPADSPQISAQPPDTPQTTHYSPFPLEADTISLSDILLILAEQLKVILLVPFITVFLTFTHVQFLEEPLYVSWTKVLLPEKIESLGGLAGIASQFGVSVPTGRKADLSSPSLFPELLRSRTFAEKILDKPFHTKKFGKELSLLAILTHGNDRPKFGKDTLITMAQSSLDGILEFIQNPSTAFSVIKITVFEPVFAKELAEVVLAELEDLNRYFKSQIVSEKTIFIESRIFAVESDLELSELRLKAFKEQNRQIASPALQLEQEQLTRDVEVQKSVYLTLKQQLELAKIEEVQEASIVQILDKPQIPLGPSNKNIKLSVLLAVMLGIGLGIVLGFIRSYLNNSDIDERRKLRRVRNFIKKKGKDAILDHRMSIIVSILLIVGLPFYLGHKSQNPVYFGMYSPAMMFVNTVYILTLIASIILFFHLRRRKN
jgi:uncharacterized protein involved in exopolysaccharide biosynthesis